MDYGKAGLGLVSGVVGIIGYRAWSMCQSHSRFLEIFVLDGDIFQSKNCDPLSFVYVCTSYHVILIISPEISPMVTCSPPPTY